MRRGFGFRELRVQGFGCDARFSLRYFDVEGPDEP